MSLRRTRIAAGPVLFLACMAIASLAQPPPTPHADDPLVDLATVDDTILVELRYATTRNITGKPLYPPGSRCLVRRDVAESLKIAQAWLVPQGFRLKIWDAYRPVSAQQALWDQSKNRSFVSSPTDGHPLHTWGVAVDATLVDAAGKELKMPTDFDDFSPASAMAYRGGDPVVARNLSLLQRAMARGGFVGMRTEWWHFIGKNWRTGKPTQVDSLLPDKDGRWHAANPPSATPVEASVPKSNGDTPRRQPEQK